MVQFRLKKVGYPTVEERSKKTTELTEKYGKIRSIKSTKDEVIIEIEEKS